MTGTSQNFLFMAFISFQPMFSGSMVKNENIPFTAENSPPTSSLPGSESVL